MRFFVLFSALLLAGCAAPTPSDPSASSSATESSGGAPAGVAEERIVPIDFFLTSHPRICAAVVCATGSSEDRYELPTAAYRRFDVNVTLATDEQSTVAGALREVRFTVSCVPAGKGSCAGGTVTEGSGEFPVRLQASLAMLATDVLAFDVEPADAVEDQLGGSGARYHVVGNAVAI